MFPLCSEFTGIEIGVTAISTSELTAECHACETQLTKQGTAKPQNRNTHQLPFATQLSELWKIEFNT